MQKKRVERVDATGFMGYFYIPDLYHWLWRHPCWSARIRSSRCGTVITAATTWPAGHLADAGRRQSVPRLYLCESPSPPILAGRSRA
ncbi:hypothetical protein ACNKHM_09985 [Shigella sonnei]